MKMVRIMFTSTSKEVALEKIKIIKNIVGEENVNEYGVDYPYPEVLVRCSKKQSRELDFKLDLTHGYLLG